MPWRLLPVRTGVVVPVVARRCGACRRASGCGRRSSSCRRTPRPPAGQAAGRPAASSAGPARARPALAAAERAAAGNSLAASIAPKSPATMNVQRAAVAVEPDPHQGVQQHRRTGRRRQVVVDRDGERGQERAEHAAAITKIRPQSVVPSRSTSRAMKRKISSRQAPLIVISMKRPIS